MTSTTFLIVILSFLLVPLLIVLYLLLTKSKKDLKDEYILCAANHYDDGVWHVHQPINIPTGYVICGQRHHNCNYTFSLIQEDANRADTVKLMNACTQGFLTNSNRFVGRKEAAEIAVNAFQVIKEEISSPRIGLHSEDLY